LAVIQALYDAADDDSATGGPDMQRKIFPVVLAATADGVRKMSEVETTEMITRLMASRTERPDGPGAPLA
jgi:proteasome beta subunit